MASGSRATTYILPKRQSNGGAAIITLPIQPRLVRPATVISRTGGIQKHQQRTFGHRTVSKMTPLGQTRRLYMAPAASSAVVTVPDQQPAVPTSRYIAHQPPHPARQYRPQSQSRAALYKLASRQKEMMSEEDEFDVDEVYQLLDESAGFRAHEMEGPRRRERLTNLTPEEKMDRRKHKNRIAAQAARDRKKVNTQRLEDSLRGALLEIGRLRNEVNVLRAENARLEAENQTMQLEKWEPDSQQMDEQMVYEEAPQQKQSFVPKHQYQQNDYQFEDFNEVKPFVVRQHPKAQRFVVENGADQQQQQQQQQQQPCSDSVGSAAGAGIRATAAAAATAGLQQQQQHNLQVVSDKANNGGNKADGNVMCAKGVDGTVDSGGPQQDAELQRIFDELFEDFEFPVDVDRFCNEVIEEGIAATGAQAGPGQIGPAQQQQTEGRSECMSATDADGQSPGQKSPQIVVVVQPSEDKGLVAHQHFVGTGGAAGGGATGRCTTTETALMSPPSAENGYFMQMRAQPPPLSPPTKSATPVSMSNNDSLLDNGSSPAYQTVPSPYFTQLYSTHSQSTYIDHQHQFDYDQHQFIPAENDPMLSGASAKEKFGHFGEQSPELSQYPPLTLLDNQEYGYDTEEAYSVADASMMAVCTISSAGDDVDAFNFSNHSPASSSSGSDLCTFLSH